MNWIDKLLEIGSTPDWVSPLMGIVDEIKHGGGDVVVFSRHSHSVIQATRLLRRNNIECWNDYIDDDGNGVVTVPHGQGIVATRLLNG